MSNPTLQTTQTTKDGTFVNLRKGLPVENNQKEALEANLISKAEHDTINTFFDKIHQATVNEEEWVETTPEIITHYNKKGLGKGVEYFIFQGIKVTEYGKSERLKTSMARQIDTINHGDDAGRVNQIDKVRATTGHNRVG